MRKFERVLSDDDINDFFHLFQHRHFPGRKSMGYALAKDIEQTVLTKLAEQEPKWWAVHMRERTFATDNKDKAKAYADIKEKWAPLVTPLYLAPTLPLEPSDELIAEIKAVADIRLVNGKTELSNVREIIHTIAHSLSN